ncbi:MAG: ATPase, T2SS/T4P/T4SS family [Oscillospiraceae bacterium]
MSITTYEFLSILQAQGNNDSDNGKNGIDYISVLNSVRSTIAQSHAAELAAALNDENAAQTLKNLILKYTAENLTGKDFDRDALVERIYQDMAGLGILTKYLFDPSVEEINVNGYNAVEIIRSDRTDYLYGTESFPSPSAALDIVKRMVRMGGMILDAQTPRVDSYIGSGTRISAIIPPLVPLEQGVIVSIRKQNSNRITREQLIASGSATADMLDFLSMCLCYGVSIGAAGGTGSGKSTLMSYLLNDYIMKNDDNNNRIYIIEDSRELNLMDYDNANDRPARVLYTVTKGAPNPVSMHDLIVSALRFHPSLIVPAEVRDGAAYQAAIAGQTGHTILTSFHADGAEDGYRRLVSMCHTAGTRLNNDQLYEMCISAWPIIIFQKQLKDNSRKIMEIFEARGMLDGTVKGKMLYRFDVDRVERDNRGRINLVKGNGCRWREDNI